jgi:large subunit ribosomal protein L17
MRHLKSGRKLSRNSSHRWALMRNLITCLLREERIQTTDPKAKEVRRWVDRVITLGKQGSLHARRQALGIVQDKAMVRKLFDMLAPRFKDRPGGYTRIVKIGRRRGDSAPLSIIELVASAEDAKAQAESGKQKRGTRRRRRASAKEADSTKEATAGKPSRGATA